VIWSALESFLGLTPHPDRLEVNPVLPSGWDWVAIANMPYRGYPLSILADARTQTLYTTAAVESSWRQVVASATLQSEYTFRSDNEPFWLVVPDGLGLLLLAASSEATQGQLVERKTGRVLAEVSIPPGGVVRVKVK
jgi:hypothetical protein